MPKTHNGGTPPTVLISVLHGHRKNSSPERFTRRRKVAGALQIGGWVGLTHGSDTLEKKKNSTAPAKNRTTIPRLSNPQRGG